MPVPQFSLQLAKRKRGVMICFAPPVLSALWREIYFGSTLFSRKGAKEY